MTVNYSLDTIKAHPNLSVPWYLIAMYSENILCEPLLNRKDTYFLSRFMIANFDRITHPHKALITVEELEDATLFLEEDVYPSITKDATEAIRLRVSFENKEEPKSDSG